MWKDEGWTDAGAEIDSDTRGDSRRRWAHAALVASTLPDSHPAPAHLEAAREKPGQQRISERHMTFPAVPLPLCMQADALLERVQ